MSPDRGCRSCGDEELEMSLESQKKKPIFNAPSLHSTHSLLQNLARHAPFSQRTVNVAPSTGKKH